MNPVLNRRLMKAYLLKESLDRLWNYTYEGSMLRYLASWVYQLRWQRLKPMDKLARMLLDHLEGILNYCRTKVLLGVVEAVNGNIKALRRRGHGYQDLSYCCSRRNASRPRRPNSSLFGKPRKMRTFTDSCAEPGKGCIEIQIL
jgi:hypothetical protein